MLSFHPDRGTLFICTRWSDCVKGKSGATHFCRCAFASLKMTHTHTCARPHARRGYVSAGRSCATRLSVAFWTNTAVARRTSPPVSPRPSADIVLDPPVSQGVTGWHLLKEVASRVRRELTVLPSRRPLKLQPPKGERERAREKACVFSTPQKEKETMELLRLATLPEWQHPSRLRASGVALQTPLISAQFKM